ncbi:RNA-binding protein [Garciella nitratireducens]|uniref:RNA-binding protein YlmH, contains S4-like domain n=1 Tax=Garciella nitratireducens DSM 15102 TaxID=1121911 RepID=A0A1T4JZM4_9FIRM|nr:YlmH/Sll1252 family protein [Garciella nitratireducens]SJZ35630.1 RNA-binding protein YlmH, contains S4-like domain [Garciella nitratireducens DSM 15102]
MKKEEDFIFLKAKMQDTVHWVDKTNSRKFSCFLDPLQQKFCKNILVQESSVQFQFFGGHEYCERKMLCIFPQNSSLTIWEWPIAILHIYPKSYKKNNKLRHPEILGRLMNLGIQRNRVGDINIINDFIQIFVQEKLKEYIKYHLEKISNIPVEISEVDWKEVVSFQPSFEEMYITTSSLRLDSMISKIFGLSRKEAMIFIKSGKVKVNWEYITHSSMQLIEKDVISVKGKGRATFCKILGNTKKGNKKILIRKNK